MVATSWAVEGTGSVTFAATADRVGNRYKSHSGLACELRPIVYRRVRFADGEFEAIRPPGLCVDLDLSVQRKSERQRA